MMDDITYSPEWDKIHKEWNERYKGQARPDRDFAQFFIMESPRKGSKFLDLGCGYGSNILPLLNYNYFAEGVDGCRDAIDHLNAKKLYGLTATLGNIGSIEREAGSFEYVLDVCCLEIFSNKSHRDFIKKCSGWLTSGGKIFSKIACEPFDRRLMRFPIEPRSFGDIKYIFKGFLVDVIQSFECNEDGARQSHWLVTVRT